MKKVIEMIHSKHTNKKFIKILFSIITITGIFALSGCAKEDTKVVAKEQASYQTITASEAKELMETLDSYTIVDVRTLEEYNEGYIEGAILLPDYEVSAKASEVLKDPSANILVYCRSGRRSKLAAQALVDLGYTNVYDFGGIIDWPYETVKP